MAALLSRDSGPALGPRRTEVLEVLRAAGEPLGVREVAGRTGVHPNTARFHLDALVSAGLAARAPQSRPSPGRPSFGYQTVGSGTVSEQRQYRLLAEMLASLIEGLLPEPGQAAAEAGREWGRYLTEQPAPYQRIAAGEAIGRLVAVLAEIGFAPQAAVSGVHRQVRLQRCPFREVAENRQDVVCQLHLGLMQGVLDQMRAPVMAQRIQPFAEPSLCIAYLADQPAPGPRGEPEAP